MAVGAGTYVLLLVVGFFVIYAANVIFFEKYFNLTLGQLFGFSGGEIYSDETPLILPGDLSVLDACTTLQRRYFEKGDYLSPHVLASTRYHWKQLKCSSVIGNKFHVGSNAQTLDSPVTKKSSSPGASGTGTDTTSTPTAAISTATEEVFQLDSKERIIRINQEKKVMKCYALRKKTGILPGRSWGKATRDQQKDWQKYNCDKFGAIMPGLIHSREMDTTTDSNSGQNQMMNENLKLGSDDNKSSIAPVSSLEGVPTGGGTTNENKKPVESDGILNMQHNKEDTAWCFTNRKKYGVIPQKSWGTLPESLRIEWKERVCDVVFSLKRRKGYKIVQCPMSNLPSNNTAAAKLPLIAIMAASTTRKVRRPSPKTMSLFTYLLPSLRTSIDCGFRYIFVMGFDEGDAYHDSEGGMGKTKAWFKQHIQDILEQNGIQISFLPVKVRNTLKKPGPIFIAMARAAYEAEADYFYRVNDDTEMVGRWPSRFVGALQKLPPPYGVVGPFCEVNKKILTHDFVHRTHMDIFGMNYYPPALVDWWMDDWVTLVYGFSRTLISRKAEVIHHTGAHGQRYQVNQANEKKVNSLVQEGRQMIRQWMLKHEVPLDEIATFDKETKANYKTGNIKIQVLEGFAQQ
jgi:hypothetical protein